MEYHRTFSFACWGGWWNVALAEWKKRPQAWVMLPLQDVDLLNWCRMIFYGGMTERGRVCKGAVDACRYDDRYSVGQMIFKGFKIYMVYVMWNWRIGWQLAGCIKSSAAEDRAVWYLHAIARLLLVLRGLMEWRCDGVEGSGADESSDRPTRNASEWKKLPQAYFGICRLRHFKQ